MDRSQIESLSTDELRQLIVDATAVLAARAEGKAPQKAVSASPVADASPGSGLFTFGLPASSSAAQPSSGGLFSTAGGSKLFGGTGAGLFSGSSAGAIFSDPSGSSGSGLFGTSSIGTSIFGGSAASGASAKLSCGYPGGQVKQAVRGEGDGEEAEEEDELVKEEEVTAIHGWTPSLTLEVRDSIETGEEAEDVLYNQRSKLYRFREGEWKERGLGEAKLLKSKATGRVRFLMRQEKTGKVVGNHYLLDSKPYCQLSKNADSDKIWVWCAQDFSDGELAVEQLALKFGTKELAEAFRDAFEKAKLDNAKALELDKEKAES